MIRLRRESRRLALCMLVAGMLPLLAACSSGDEGGFVAWEPPTIEAPVLTPTEMPASPTSPPVMATDVPASPEVPPAPAPTTTNATAAAPSAVANASKLTPEELKTYQPNEIGWIPVMEYHVITTDPAGEADQFVRTADHMREDLQFLYDHDFYVIPMRELVRNEITAPPGKHPVVLTFDDATASQFRWDDVNGKRVVDPDTAIGVLESFFAEHPDFGKGGFFAVLPNNCFADGTKYNTMDDCTDKLVWMAENGYEIGLHTLVHQDMLDVSDEEFKEQIGGDALWVDERVQGPGNMSRVLALPFGNYPDREKHPEQRRMMREGFTYNGVEIKLEGALMVGANPTESPSSATYDPVFIARIQAFKDSLDLWFPQFASGAVSLYTSDGNPDVISVPSEIPGDLDGQFDADLILASGKELVHYDVETGTVATRSREILAASRAEVQHHAWRQERWV